MTGSDRRARLVDQMRTAGAPLTPELAAAFAAVPREAFVPDGFQRPRGGWVTPRDHDFLDLVHRDDVLVTKVDGRLPISSSSQPSLMAIMLAALDVRPGHRVLEIGAGTGYNAALLAALGATVVSVDVQDDVAARATAALRGVGVEGVEVQTGDGYAGAPGHRFDRVIVTVGVAGLSPRWLNQLDPGGLAVVPVEHAGTHPVLAVRGAAAGPVTAEVICPSGFMSAAGPLTAHHQFAHPAPAAPGELAPLTPASAPRFDPPVDAITYRDLWYAAGVWHRRATHAAIPGTEHSCLVLLDEDRVNGAAIPPDGSVLTTGSRALAQDAGDILRRWDTEGRPPMQSWRVTLALAGHPEAPIWVPANWSLQPRVS
ncbi:methyltransferase domain-containing protein [Actinoplanes sp. NPDC089786]|uniref:protein-L-isoaspartate O-methyltransferase family protein n=1 Tax=Actinoplanes sp. NPDC089786 TaxID=3155185 RepID=UPI00341D4480